MTKKPTLLGGIKAKLISATCMLLVAVIMVVSSTYAWFTLSTAPEVTGITTAVGANGALEMLLATKEDAAWFYGSGTVGTSAPNTERNTYWGNLVNLDDNAYGLEKIVLYPSQLNTTVENDKTMIGETAFLKVPVYGPDGRVSELSDKTSTGVYDSVEDAFFPGDEFGVRGVGSASGMTPRQLAYRNAVAAVGTNMRQAQQIAAASLNANGGDIANIAIKHAVADEGADKYASTDVDKLLGVVTELEKSVAALESAYKQALLAIAASNLVTGDGAEEAHTVVAGYISGGKSLDEMITEIKTLTGLTDDQLVIGAYVTKLNATKADVAAARSGLEAAKTKAEGGQELLWADIGTPMGKLVDTTKMTINGYPVAGFREKMSEIVSSVLAQGGLQLIVSSGGGVYADVADHCGNYQASIVIEKVEYNGLALENMTARMKTNIRGEWTWKADATEEQKVDANIGNTDYGSYATLTPYLDVVSAAVSGKRPASATGVNLPMTEFYGYIIDMAFRTNAADSDLLLQIDGTDRIYSDNSNEETMGHGSSMTFVSTDDSFSAETMKNLMKCIRIVFFDTQGLNILATAKLDVDNATYGTDGWTAKMYLYTVGTTTTPVTDENGNYMSKDEPSVIKYYYNSADQKYYNEQEFTTEATVDMALVATTTTEGAEVRKTQEESVITALTQNTPAHISALVYLDGTTIQNKDVSIGKTSMTGKMNLQFSSSATLVPMEYADLHTPNTPAQGGGNP